MVVVVVVVVWLLLVLQLTKVIGGFLCRNIVGEPFSAPSLIESHATARILITRLVSFVCLLTLYVFTKISCPFDMYLYYETTN